jgi:hypothetical protein
VLAVTMAALALGGCNPLSPFAPSETELLTADYVPRDSFPPGPPVYCYRTLAEVDCYRHLQPDEESRLVAGDPPVEYR